MVGETSVTVSYEIFLATGQSNSFVQRKMNSGANLLGYYTVDSFATWDTPRTLSCPFPPCLGDVQRPTPQLGSVNVFESSASSIYHGLTVSLRRRMHHGFGMRVAYTWARAMDDGQDALVVGRPATS